MSTKHCTNKITYGTITNKFNNSKTFSKTSGQKHFLAMWFHSFFVVYNSHYLFVISEALKYPHICMSLVFEVDEVKNKCFRKHELTDIFYH